MYAQLDSSVSYLDKSAHILYASDRGFLGHWSLCSSLGTAAHHRFKAVESSTYIHDGRIFGIRYGSGHLLGVMAKDILRVKPQMLQIGS